MIVSFLEFQVKDSLKLTLEQNDKGSVLSHASTLKIPEQASLLLVPYCLVDLDVDYTFQDLIQHVRFSASQNVASLPIVVVGAGADSEEHIISFASCGVKFTDQLSDSAISFAERPTNRALSEFIDRFGNERLGIGSRHDEANRWGAFCLLYALSTLNGKHETQLNLLSDRLSEDLFYKKMVLRIKRSGVQHPLKNTLIELNRKWSSLARKDFAVLVVEDELDIGWGDAYRAALGNVELKTAATYDEAIRQIDSQFDLILLDVRLDRNLSLRSVTHLPGIKVARKFRAHSSGLPIMACTASDKAVTLEALQKYRINGFWIKPHPDIVRTWDGVIETGIDFLKKLIALTEWASRTRPLIDCFFGIVETANKSLPKKNPQSHLQSEILNKANSFYALLFEEFSQSQREISENIQIDLAFLIAFSLINELIYLKCSEEGVHGSINYSLVCNHNNEKHTILEKIDSGYRIKQKYTPLSSNSRILSDNSFPDILVFEAILFVFKLHSQCELFKRLINVRNKLSITHGKVDKVDGGGAKTASIENIKELLKIYKALVEA